jgi:hypothetical protein
LAGQKAMSLAKQMELRLARQKVKSSELRWEMHLGLQMVLH